MERIIEFLKEYEEVCKNYNISIGACGCCSSPYLCAGTDDYDISHIHFVESENKLRFTYWNGDKTMYDIDIERLEEIVNKG